MSGYIDLHLHLDGAITAPIARRLAEMQGIPLPASDAELERAIRVPEGCASLSEFLKRFELPCSLLQVPEALEEAVRLVAEDAASHGCLYAEVRFAPQLHGARGMTQDEAVAAAEHGAAAAPIPCNLILCLMRGDLTADANDETVTVAARRLVRTGGVVALDLAGDEAGRPTADYREPFSRARALGVPFTIHAGEAGGPEEVRAAVRMGAARIGHGVRAAEDPALVELLAEREVPLEICPTSNRLTRAVPSMGCYPLADLLEAGVCCTLNTDDPAIEGTDIAREFSYAENDLGLGRAWRGALLSNAVGAAFTDEATKARLRSELGL